MVKLTVREAALEADAVEFRDWGRSLAEAWRTATDGSELQEAQTGAMTSNVAQFWPRYIQARDGLEKYVGPDSQADGPGASGALLAFAAALGDSVARYTTARADVGRLVARIGK